MNLDALDFYRIVAKGLNECLHYNADYSVIEVTEDNGKWHIEVSQQPKENAP